MKPSATPAPDAEDSAGMSPRERLERLMRGQLLAVGGGAAVGVPAMAGAFGVPLSGLTADEYKSMVAGAREMGSKIRPHRVSRLNEVYRGPNIRWSGDTKPWTLDTIFRSFTPTGESKPAVSPPFMPQYRPGLLVPEELEGAVAAGRKAGLNPDVLRGNLISPRALRQFRRRMRIPELRVAESSPAGVVAHELGHSTGPGATPIDLRKGLLRGNIKQLPLLGSRAATPFAAGLASLISGASDDDRKAIAGNVSANIIATPMVYEELRASTAGAKLLRRIGKNRAAAFIGVPSYLAMMGAPWATMGLRKAWNKHKKKSISTKTSSDRSTAMHDDKAYWQGFCAKCAETGVDPDSLLKEALTINPALRLAAVGRMLNRVGSIPSGFGQFPAVAKQVGRLGQVARGATRGMGSDLNANLANLYAMSKNLSPTARVEGRPILDRLASSLLSRGGYSPEQASQLMGQFAKGIRPNLMGAGGRYVGGFAPKMSPQLAGVVAGAGDAMRKATGLPGRAWQLLTGSRGRALEGAAGKVMSSANPTDIAANRAQAMFAGLTNQAGNEAGKVLGTRLAAGGAGLGGLYAMSGGGSTQQKYEMPDDRTNFVGLSRANPYLR